MMLLLTALRGNAFIYQGEELGLPQGEVAFEDLQDPEAIANWPHTLGRDGARTPLPWTSTARNAGFTRSDEHTSELQSLMRSSYAVCCLNKKKRDIPPLFTPAQLQHTAY